jgi:hypothetical protein
MAKKPTIALIPSGYKTATPFGKLYSILPNDGTQDFRIDRATVGTRYNKDGLIVEELADTPRLDYLNSNCPAVLRETQVLQELADSDGWSGISTTNATLSTPTDITSPEGNNDAVRTLTATSTSQPRLEETLAVPGSNTTYTWSIFVKKGTAQYVGLSHFSVNTQNVTFDLNDGTIEDDNGTDGDGAKIEDYGNGWYRISKTVDVLSTSANNVFKVHLSSATNYFTGVNGETAHFWGMQIQKGVGATSYIKTTGTTLTKNLDNINCENETYKTGNDVTWYLEFNSHSFVTSFRPLIVIRNSGFTQTMDVISYNSGSDYYFRIRTTHQSALQTIIAFGEDAIQMFTRNKLAIRLYGSNFEIYVNGTREYTGTSADGDWTLLNNSAVLNDFGSNTEAPSMRLYDFRVYNQTMTQSELETLTTL